MAITRRSRMHLAMNKFLKQTFDYAVYAISVVFTLVPEAFFEQHKLVEKLSNEINTIINRVIAFAAVMALIATVHALFLCLRWSVRIKGKNYSIKVGYGDIFKKKNCKVVIPFDECFTTEVGVAPDEIKPTSICGQYLLNHPIEDMAPLIKSAKLKPLESKSQHNSRERYESGRLVPRDNYLLMSFAKLDKDGLGRMTRDEYIDCLSVLWSEIDKYYGQTDVCISVLGSGITRLDDTSLSQQELLDMIIKSYQLSAHKIKKPAQLHIVCRRSDDFSLNRIGEYM